MEYFAECVSLWMENRMNRNDEFRRKKDAHRRLIKRKRRRRSGILAGMLLITVIALAGFFLKDRFFPGAKLPDGHEAESVESEEVDEREVVVIQDTEEIIHDFQYGSVEESLDPQKTLPRRVDLHQLSPGRNHSMKASRYAYSTEEVRGWIWGGIPYDGEKVAFLTFDDGPVENSYAILDILKRRNVPATFFIPGYVLDEHADKKVLHRYIEEGHAIGIHSYSHVYDKLYPGRSADKDVIMEEFIATRDLMRETLGDTFDSKVFRFPGGSMSWNKIKEAQAKLNKSGIYDMDWNAISGDGEPKSRRPDGAEAMAEHVMYTLEEHWIQDIAVVLMHDTKSITAEYLDQVIDQFIEAGYTFGILE
jgi:peptidoglycan-N-acetylglucosamine deacetylase